MKNLSDLLQILLSLSGWLGFAACAFIAWALIQAGSLMSLCLYAVRSTWVILKRFLILPSLPNIYIVLFWGAVIFFSRSVLSDGLQWAEYVVFPVYETSDTSTHALAIYEAELRSHVDQYEFEIVQRRTRETAAKVGTTPLCIYEVAYSECGLNPFEIRTDGIAAGWIQFTTVGLTGLGCSLDQIKMACKTRNTAMIMDMTERYLISRSNGRQMPRPVDVYNCVFAPAFVGAPDNQVLYSGWNNPAYYKNDGFDGYHAKDGRIFRSRSEKDGAITVGELRLHLEAKKSALLKQYQ